MISKNKDKIVSVRFNEDDLKLIKVACFTLGMTPSRYLRMLADASINGIKLKIKEGSLKYEDIETILND